MAVGQPDKLAPVNRVHLLGGYFMRAAPASKIGASRNPPIWTTKLARYTGEREMRSALLRHATIIANGTSQRQTLWLNSCQEKSPYRTGSSIRTLAARTEMPRTTVLTFR